jgi:DNA-binding NarL/FixJ family response regulator
MKKPESPDAPRPARVLVVDDHPIFRTGLIALLDTQPNLTCCGQIAHAREVIASVKEHGPDLLLLDLRLGDGDGLDLLPQLREHFPKLPILVLSQSDEELYAERALRAGARGYIMKEEVTEDVLTAINTLLAGGYYTSAKLNGKLMQGYLAGGPRAKGSGVESLANRELQIFRMLGEGLSCKRIAERLSISIKTVQTHRENIKHKLHLPDGPTLMRHATTWVEQSDKPGK